MKSQGKLYIFQSEIGKRKTLSNKRVKIGHFWGARPSLLQFFTIMTNFYGKKTMHLCNLLINTFQMQQKLSQ